MINNHHIYGPGGKPLTADRRHIVIDNMQKIVFIQVKVDLQGKIKEQEYQDIKNGLWYKYVHNDIKDGIRDAITNGYEIRPFWTTGMYDEDYYIVQITELRKQLILDPKNYH